MLTEKYRPETLDDVIGHPEIVKAFKSYVETGTMPHMILMGKAGIGKTTCAIALAKELGCYPHAFLEINASDDNGVKVMRGKVKEFCKRKSFAQVPFKIILFDEGDRMTPAAQHALRRTMETYSKTTRFVITGNSMKDIIGPIKSRCDKKYFKALTDADLQAILLRVQIGEEKILPAEVNQAIIELAEGDGRAIVNLTETAINYDGITPDILFRMSGKADAESVRSLLHVAFKGDIGALDYVNKLIYDGTSPTEIISSIYFTAMRNKNLDDDKRLDLLEVMRSIPGVDDKMVLGGIIGSLVKLRRNA